VHGQTDATAAFSLTAVLRWTRFLVGFFFVATFPRRLLVQAGSQSGKPISSSVQLWTRRQRK
jgi:phosphodiesterase/alkaline phosphatase D-like protein